MSRQRSRSARRRRITQSYTDISKVQLPGPLRLLTNPKVFAVVGIVFAVAILGGLMYGIIGRNSNSSSSNPLAQPNEAADAPIAGTGTPEATPAAQPTAVQVKRYDTAPPMTIDPSKSYTATIKTTQGDVVVQLDAKDAPQTVNSFVFLAQQGYYNGNPFFETLDNSKPFIAATGDPTGTGLVRPGYVTPAEPNPSPFIAGAVGMGDTSKATNDGSFWISFGDYPAYTGRFTIFGKVVSGLDVLSKLRYADPHSPSSDVDKIISITIGES